jgi:hypothetical protein
MIRPQSACIVLAAAASLALAGAASAGVRRTPACADPAATGALDDDVADVRPTLMMVPHYKGDEPAVLEVSVAFGPDGSVSSASLVCSTSRDPRFAPLTLRMASGWRFEPVDQTDTAVTFRIVARADGSDEVSIVRQAVRSPAALKVSAAMPSQP